MGSGGKTKHASYPVAPAGPAGHPPPGGAGPVPASEAGAAGAGAAFTEALAQLEGALGYEELAQATAAALEAHAGELAQGWPPQLAAEALKELKAKVGAQLGSLPIEQLQALAAGQGFEHPTLVGWSTPPGGQHPLAHWLDPVYPPESPSKLAIQAKAAERFAKLAAGETLNGLTLADVVAQEAGLPGHQPQGGWHATPAEVIGALTAFNQALAAVPAYSSSGQALAELVAAENRLVSAHCPGMPAAELAAAKAAAKANVDQSLAKTYGAWKQEAAATLVAEASAKGTIDAASAKFLSADDQIALVRLSTPAGEREGLQGLAATRADQVAALSKLHQAYAAHPLKGVEPEGLASWAKTAGAYFGAAKEVGEWASSSAAASELTPAVAGHGWKATQLTTQFRAWAKGQSLEELRGAAKALGMDLKGGSRAQVQNWIAASWDPGLSKAEIQAALAAKQHAGGQPGKAAPQVPKSVTPAPAPLSAGAALAAAPGPGSFAAKHQGIVAALKAHRAVIGDLPPRPAAAEVEGWSFGPGQSAGLGGAHRKTLHAAPDGGLWLFKPDASGGARAAAEAAASQIYHRVGIPSVGVYVRTLEGKVGSIQPLLSGASTLPANHKSWTQADVDAMVRLHVGAWAVGDHDANHINVLRTPSGGLLPVDGGQAFKFFGTDRLDTEYHPNSSYGAAPPVFHQAYKAALAGGLAPGVRIRPEAALPAIRAFEAIPESQYRSMVGGIAAKGVAGGAHWVPAVRKAAQKRLGKKAVSDAEVAEEFVRQAVARKQGLRKAFTAFFAKLGFDGASKLDKVA